MHTRIEAYSCKPVKKDKKLTKAMETTFQEVQAEIKQSVGSPDDLLLEDDALFASPFGHLNRPQSRKTVSVPFIKTKSAHMTSSPTVPLAVPSHPALEPRFPGL